MLENISEVDLEVKNAIDLELNRQRKNIELITSENIVSKAVLEAMGSVLTNKYAEGYPGRRYYGGCEFVDIVENLARDRAKELFGAEHANVQPHSGAQANMTVYLAVLKPGDTVLGMDLSHGGHLTHGSKVNSSGMLYNFVSYGINPDTYTIDYEDVRKKALENKPKLIVAGASAYPREIDFKKFREIADEVNAYLMVASLVAATVPEYIVSVPRLKPRFMPESTRSYFLLSPTIPHLTQSAGVESTTQASTPSKRSIFLISNPRLISRQ